MTNRIPRRLLTQFMGADGSSVFVLSKGAWRLLGPQLTFRFRISIRRGSVGDTDTPKTTSER
ncbi:MAG: hypothetical protein ACREJ4_03430, partial [Candidatus Methylomirabilaceae bacterium]